MLIDKQWAFFVSGIFELPAEVGNIYIKFNEIIVRLTFKHSR